MCSNHKRSPRRVKPSEPPVRTSSPITRCKKLSQEPLQPHRSRNQTRSEPQQQRDHKRPTESSRKSERPATKKGERRRGEKRQQGQQRETRDGTRQIGTRQSKTSAETRKQYLVIISKPARSACRFVQVLLRFPLRPRLHVQGESMCKSRKTRETASKHNTKEQKTSGERICRKARFFGPASSVLPVPA